MMQQLIIMTRKPKKDRSADRHKPGKMARIRGTLAEQAQAAADKIEADFTEWVNIAVREKLEREGWREKPNVSD